MDRSRTEILISFISNDPYILHELDIFIWRKSRTNWHPESIQVAHRSWWREKILKMRKNEFIASRKPVNGRYEPERMLKQEYRPRLCAEECKIRDRCVWFKEEQGRPDGETASLRVFKRIVVPKLHNCVLILIILILWNIMNICN